MAMENSITENISVKPERPRRGRPPLVAPIWNDVIKSLYGGQSERTRLNRYYMLRAMTTLGLDNNAPADHPHLWLHDRGSGTIKQTILTELGRVEDEMVMQALADGVCQRKMRTQAAVAYIHRVRFRAVPAKDADNDHVQTLSTRLLATINDYLARYDVNWIEIGEALDHVQSLVERQAKPGRESADA